jgi:hypothetical protein
MSVFITTWIWSEDETTIAVIELPDCQLFKDVEAVESFGVIVDGIMELLEPKLLENLVLSFVKHYTKSVFNMVLSDNKKFLARHVSKEYTSYLVKQKLSQERFEKVNVVINAEGTQLEFINNAEETEVSASHLIAFYNPPQV